MNPSSSFHLIAEAGTNHGGSIETARQLIDAAREAGADSVKFQVIYPEGLYLPEFLVNGAYVPNEVFAKRQAAMLSDDDWRRLADDARAKSLPLSASVFDQRGLDLLDALDAPYIKIASCDLNNTPLLEAAARVCVQRPERDRSPVAAAPSKEPLGETSTAGANPSAAGGDRPRSGHGKHLPARGRRLIVSTGMSSLSEIERAVAAILRVGPVELVLMHCVSIYPCPTAQTNLGFIDTLRREFGLTVGFSDHTEGSVAATIAIAKGATWIEKHLTLDRAAVGFDHAYAMEPAMLKAYLVDLRAGEAAGRAAAEKVQPAEAGVRQRARRAIYAARDLQPGETIAATDVLIVRPEGPISPEDARRVVGTRTRKSFRRFEPITWEGIAA